MALSFSRPDPSSPDAVAAASFSTGRRGFEQSEVRDFLRMVAAELARLQERERYLDRELRTAQRNAPNPAMPLDEEVVTRLLGEEAARILTTSRDAASQIKIRAEEAASRLLREATDEAQRIREEAQLEAARRRQDATADAESEVEMAKQQGREMVNEARAYRERVLSELARRREAAREQIEQLVHGRDRLVQAFERARVAAVDVMSELTPLGEPSEYVNLALTTGPVPVMVPNQAPPAARPSAFVAKPVSPVVDAAVPDATTALHRDATPEDEPVARAAVVSLFAGEVILDDPPPSVDEVSVDEIHVDDTADAVAAEVDGLELEPVAVATLVEEPSQDVTADAETDDEVTDDAETDDAESAADAPAVDELSVVEADAADAIDTEIDPEIDTETDTEIDAAVAAVDVADDETVMDESSPAEADEAPAEPAVDAAAVDDLFARLRAARAASVAERAAMGTVVAPREPAATPPAADATTALHRPEPLSVFDPSPAAPEASGEIDDTPFGRRDTALAPAIIAGARKLKRVLADEQNDVLHALRRTAVVTAIEPMLPGEAEHGQRYASAIAAELADAVAAGAASVSTASRSELSRRLGTTATSEAVATLTAAIVAPLRERLSRAITAADGDNTELASLARAIYREWKIQQIDEHLDEVIRIAFGRGALAALEPGTPVRWVHDPRFPVCADCDDNGLSGVIGAGEPFATGQPCAPAHEGCRCMLATVAG